VGVVSYDWHNLPDDPRRANAECQGGNECPCERLGLEMECASAFYRENECQVEHSEERTDGETCRMTVTVDNKGRAETIAACWNEYGLASEIEEDSGDWVVYGVAGPVVLDKLRKAGW
jgi:hypothetical protein